MTFDLSGLGGDRFGLRTLADPFLVARLHGRVQATVRPPGSKSITNRALICAALADGRSELHGVLAADDTESMLRAIAALGCGGLLDDDRVVVDGLAGDVPLDQTRIDARQSGTTARFVLPLMALGHGSGVLDAHEQMRGRPMGAVIAALESLGATLSSAERGLPIAIHANGLRGGHVALPGDVSSQFLSGLLMAGPCMRNALTVEVTTPLVSKPYVDMTIEVMRAFGAVVHQDGSMYRVEAAGYRAARYVIEPDASAASYPWAAAAICGGSVTVHGLGTTSRQGDVAFVGVLEQMGASVSRRPNTITVTVERPLKGVNVDLTEFSDTAPTFAVVAAVAVGPSTARGIGFIRAKESDRIGAAVTELRRCGVRAEEGSDGFSVHPGVILPATVATYADHRMAMSFALLGLRYDGISVAEPACVAKTYPGYWSMLDELRTSAR